MILPSVNSLLEKIAQLPEDFKTQLDVYLDSLLAKAHKQASEKNHERILGVGVGKGSMSPDFDEPLDEMKEYMQ
ncbi:MAG TPA: DUF2281 domain-containing protein [Chitinophagales bacterium]|nr:DUF2281 domain-containing protein [Chitinophagales bacterium]